MSSVGASSRVSGPLRLSFHPLQHGLAHLVGGGDVDQFAVRRRMEGRGPADEDDFCAAALRRLGQRVAHLAAGAVAEKADRVQGFAGAPGGEQHNFAGQVVAAAQGAQYGFRNGFGLGHAAGAHHAAGQLAGSRFDDPDTALAQNVEIRLGGGVLPHVDVHGRSHQHRRLGGKVHSGEEIVGDAVCKLGQDVGRGRSHHQGLGPLRLADVLDAVLRPRCTVGAFARAGVVPQAGNDFMAGEGGKSERLDEFLCGLGHDHVDFEGLTLQSANQFGRLVRGNSARDSHGYSHVWIVDGLDWERREREGRPRVPFRGRAEMRVHFCAAQGRSG